MSKYDEFYDMCIDKQELTDDHLLVCLRKAFDLTMSRLDDVIQAVKENKTDLEDVVFDARAGIAYSLNMAMNVGMNSELKRIKKLMTEQPEID